jgi:hypothetical protein
MTPIEIGAIRSDRTRCEERRDVPSDPMRKRLTVSPVSGRGENPRNYSAD